MGNSPPVAHELSLTTAHENREAIFSGVSAENAATIDGKAAINRTTKP
jgi:hypothetical protein